MTRREARELKGLVERLRDAPAPSDLARLETAALARDLPGGNGSRETFFRLAKLPDFWRNVSHDQRKTLAQNLAKATSSVESSHLGKAYASILGSPLFEHARPRGKENALNQPLRAAKLVHDMSFQSHRLTADPHQTQREARRYAEVEFNTPKGIELLTDSLCAVRDEVLTQAFEDRPVLMRYQGRSQWIGERFASVGSLNTWARAAHGYMRQRQTEDHCGSFNGDRSRCVK